MFVGVDNEVLLLTRLAWNAFYYENDKLANAEKLNLVFSRPFFVRQ